MFIFTNKTSKWIENHFHLFRHHNFGFVTISRNPFPILSCFFWSESSFLWFPNNNNRISFRFYFYSKWNSLCWRSFSMVFVASGVRFGLFFCLFVCVFFLVIFVWNRSSIFDQFPFDFINRRVWSSDGALPPFRADPRVSLSKFQQPTGHWYDDVLVSFLFFLLFLLLLLLLYHYDSASP